MATASQLSAPAPAPVSISAPGEPLVEPDDSLPEASAELHGSIHRLLNSLLELGICA